MSEVIIWFLTCMYGLGIATGLLKATGAKLTSNPIIWTYILGSLLYGWYLITIAAFFPEVSWHIMDWGTPVKSFLAPPLKDQPYIHFDSLGAMWAYNRETKFNIIIGCTVLLPVFAGIYVIFLGIFLSAAAALIGGVVALIGCGLYLTFLPILMAMKSTCKLMGIKITSFNFIKRYIAWRLKDNCK